MVHTLLMAIQSTFDLEPGSLEKGMRSGRVTAIILVQIGAVVQALKQFSRMQSEREQTLVVIHGGECGSDAPTPCRDSNLGSVLSVFSCHYFSILIPISVFSQKVGGGQKNQS